MAEARRRRRWTVEQKHRIVEETSGASVSVVARRYDINANLLFKWKREAEAGQLGGALATAAVADLVPIGVVGRGPDGAPTCSPACPVTGTGCGRVSPAGRPSWRRRRA